MKYNKLSNFKQYDTNPFAELFLTEAPAIKQRTQFIGSKGQGVVNNRLVNPDTGEVEVEQMFFRRRKVDEEKFVKIFISRFEQLWDLSKAAIRVFGYVMSAVEPDRDRFIFKIKDCMEYTKYGSRNTVLSGLAELVETGVIARTQYAFEYFINPLLFFNGNRITMAEQFIIERKKKVAPAVSKDQMDLFADPYPTVKAIADNNIENKAEMLNKISGFQEKPEAAE